MSVAHDLLFALLSRWNLLASISAPKNAFLGSARGDKRSILENRDAGMPTGGVAEDDCEPSGFRPLEKRDMESLLEGPA